MDWVRAARRKARRENRALTIADIMERISSPDRRTGSEIFRSAVHESGHAIVGMMTGRKLKAVSIRHTTRSGGRAEFEPSHSFFVTREDIENNVICCLAGRAAEIVMLGAASSGAGGDTGSDLAECTRLLLQMHNSLGLGENLFWRSPALNTSLAKPDPIVMDSVERDLQKLHSLAIGLVETHMLLIRKLAAALIERKSMTGADVANILLGPHQ